MRTTAYVGARWRCILSVLCLIAFGVLAPLALIAGWMRATLLDTDRYVETVAPLASKSAIQRLVADGVTGAIVARLPGSGTARPDASVIAETVRQVVTSEPFAAVWAEANRFSHAQLVALLTGKRVAGVQVTDGVVALDVSPLVTQVESRLASEGYTVNLTPPSGEARVTIVESDTIGEVQRGIRLLDRAAVIVWTAALVALVASVVVAPDRVRAMRRGGVALVIAMAVVLVALAGGRMIYLDALGEAAPRDAAAAVFDALTRFLWGETIVLFVIGSAAIVLAVLVERRRVRPAEAVVA